jgi:hypothetical protein
MKLTKQQFLDRFTQSEISHILAASKLNSDVEAWVFRFENIDDTTASIDIEYEDTINGVRAFESAGILAEGRADEILSIDELTNTYVNTVTLETGQKLFNDPSLWVVTGGVYQEYDLVTVTNSEGDEVAYLAKYIATGDN